MDSIERFYTLEMGHGSLNMVEEREKIFPIIFVNLIRLKILE